MIWVLLDKEASAEVTGKVCSAWHSLLSGEGSSACPVSNGIRRVSAQMPSVGAPTCT